MPLRHRLKIAWTVAFALLTVAVCWLRLVRVISVPLWLAALASCLLAAIPWLPWRFSLRTMLIGMTLVAVGAGTGCVG